MQDARRKKAEKKRLLHFSEPVDNFLLGEKKKTTKSLLVIIEELLLYRMSFKTWPPKDTPTPRIRTKDSQ